MPESVIRSTSGREVRIMRSSHQRWSCRTRRTARAAAVLVGGLGPTSWSARRMGRASGRRRQPSFAQSLAPRRAAARTRRARGAARPQRPPTSPSRRRLPPPVISTPSDADLIPFGGSQRLRKASQAEVLTRCSTGSPNGQHQNATTSRPHRASAHRSPGGTAGHQGLRLSRTGVNICLHSPERAERLGVGRLDRTGRL